MTFFNWFRLRNALVLSTTLALVSINTLDLEANPLKKRRKGGGSNSELEVFQNNLELFLGPCVSVASGDFLNSPLSFLKSNNQTYKYTYSNTKLRLSYQVGANFRLVPQPKADYFMRYLSFSAGLMYQRLGYDQTITLTTVKEGSYIDRIDLKEKYRSNYMAIPIMVRVGRRLFGEFGISADIHMNGVLDRVMERGDLYSTDTTANSNYLTLANTSYNTSKVQPKLSIGYCLAAGFMFSEHFGCRFFLNTNNRYFINEPNLGHTQYGFQLIGSIN
jgi:hypothetical protein